MIQVSQLTKEYSGRVLFKNISFTVSKGERIALVGRNGTGKSTLFKIIMGMESASEGEVQIPKNYHLSYLEQHIEFNHSTLVKECMSVLPAEKQFESYLAEKILSGLGFPVEDFQKDPNSFSGGFQLRINLVKAILKNPDFLMLDEPTNYLDITSILWLKRFLRTFPGEMLIISHDRDFLDSVCTHTLGLYRQRIHKVKGGTSKYYQLVAEEDEIYEKTRVNQEKKVKHLEKFVEQFGAKASKATQAQSKIKQIEKMDRVEKLESEHTFNLSFKFKECPAKYIVHMKDINFSYDNPPLEILKDFSISLKKDDKVGIIGKNGRGKSTLLNLMADELCVKSGELTLHQAVEIGFFGQTNINRLSESNTILEEVLSISSDITAEQVRTLCGSMLFKKDDVDKKISVLSGGEKSRVLLAKIMAFKSNLLLLDEPTNHLDQESIDELIVEMNAFKGAVVLVTHSEYILKRFANKFVVFKDGKVTIFEGSYQEFLDKVGWDSDMEIDPDNGKTKLSRKEYKHQRSELIRERSKVLSPIKAILDKNEEKIMSLEEDIEKTNELLIKASENSEGAKIQEYSSLLSKMNADVDDIFNLLEKQNEEYDLHSEKFEALLKELEDLV
jgi:ATP-binding cassette subfamily F protein 3